VLPPYTYSDTSCGIPFTEATLIANAWATCRFCIEILKLILLIKAYGAR
jgi:hypothetical protein